MSRRPLYGWLTAEAISLTGTRVSMVALPWFVLTTTGSATRTGLVALAEMLPLVVLKVLGGPVIDRVGARRVAITCDLLSVLAVGAGMVRLRGAVALVAVVSMAAGLVAVAFPGLVSVSLQQKDFVAAQNVSERLDLWTAAAQMTVEHPVLGMGPGAFALHHRDFLSSLPDDVNHPLDVAHNTWLELSSELGVLGFLAFVGMLAVAFAQAWSVWRRRRDPVAAAVCVALV
ncbi:MFS transporter, partial [Nocardioides hankookensis]